MTGDRHDAGTAADAGPDSHDGTGERPRVALDTSALMAPVECGVRVFEELDRLVGDYEPVVPRAVLAELDRLAEGGGEPARAASVGRDLADRCTIVDTDADDADDALVELAARGTVAYVVTNDRPLRDRCPPEVGTIGLRGRNQLTVH